MGMLFQTAALFDGKHALFGAHSHLAIKVWWKSRAWTVVKPRGRVGMLFQTAALFDGKLAVWCIFTLGKKVAGITSLDSGQTEAQGGHAVSDCGAL
jgi:hypothetical protein